MMRSTWANDERGSIATITALVLPLLILGGAASIQYGTMVKDQVDLQKAADAAALGAAKQLNVANAYSQSAAGAASAIASANLSPKGGDVDVVTAIVIDSGTGVKVDISRTSPSFFGKLFGQSSFNVAAHAAAHATGGPPICAIALDAKGKGTLTLDANAVVDAHACAVYVNSKDNTAIAATQSSTLKTAYTCAVGGKKGTYTNFAPQPQTGCPAIADPLASTVAPSVGSCTYTNMMVYSSTTLMPGVYCGGLHVTGGAAVTLQPGIYIIEGGPLWVDGSASLFGTYVGFFLTKYLPGSPPLPKLTTGPGAPTTQPAPGTTIFFAHASTINLTAPKTGPMAGLLFFEDRTLPQNQFHQILSDNAQTMVGTIYLPQGRLYVGANAPVSADSAYTVVVSGTLELSAGPTLVLNSNYSLSDVPVPKGVGPQGSSVSLTN